MCAQSLSCVWRYDPVVCGLPGSSIDGISHAKTNGVLRHAHLQGIFPTQGSNPSYI